MRRLSLCVAAFALVFGLSLVASGGAPHASAQDLDCADYGYSFEIDPNNDPYNLDADNDGIACEAYGPGGGGETGASDGGTDIVDDGSNVGGDQSGAGPGDESGAGPGNSDGAGPVEEAAVLPSTGAGMDSSTSSLLLIALTALAGGVLVAGLRVQKRV